LISGAVVNSIPLVIYDRDHVSGIFRDQFKQFISFGELLSQSLQLERLIYGVDIEKQNKSCQAANTLFAASSCPAPAPINASNTLSVSN
jgi:hypothetical protein